MRIAAERAEAEARVKQIDDYFNSDESCSYDGLPWEFAFLLVCLYRIVVLYENTFFICQ